MVCKFAKTMGTEGVVLLRRAVMLAVAQFAKETARAGSTILQEMSLLVHVKQYLSAKVGGVAGMRSLL